MVLRMIPLQVKPIWKLINPFRSSQEAHLVLLCRFWMENSVPTYHMLFTILGHFRKEPFQCIIICILCKFTLPVTSVTVVVINTSDNNNLNNCSPVVIAATFEASALYVTHRQLCSMFLRIIPLQIKPIWRFNTPFRSSQLRR